MINEGVYRSPKWLRNFADFEINTGDDIKGNSSKKQDSKKTGYDYYEKLRQEEERKKKQHKKEHEEKYLSLFKLVRKYIYKNYKTCELEVVKKNFFKISQDGLSFDGKRLEFNVTLDNTIVKPTFNVLITYGNETYNYTSTGQQEFKDFVISEVYPYYSSSSNKKKSNYYKSKYDSDYDPKSKSYKKTSGNNYKKTPPPPKNEKDPIKNKLRRYALLKSTLEGYKRQMDEINRWEKYNKKTHSDRVATENEIRAIERRIEQMRNEYSYEKLNYDFIELNLVEVQNRINIIKNDLGIK